MGGKGSGRRPKPLAVLKLSGGYRQDRHGRRELEDPATGVPEMPALLKGEARKLWETIVPRLVEMGIARAIDAPDLAAMCMWWSIWHSCIKTATRNASKMQAAAKAWTHFAPLADRFGMNPSARARIAIPVPAKKDKDPASKYLG